MNKKELLNTPFKGERPTPEKIEELYWQVMMGTEINFDLDPKKISDPTARNTRYYGEALDLAPNQVLKLIIIMQHWRLSKILQGLSEIEATKAPSVEITDLKK